MAEAKKPQDRKPKQKPGARTVTVRGITVTVEDAALDDFELIEDFAAIQGGQTHLIPSAMRRLFGDDFQRILDELRDEKTGRVRASEANTFFVDVFRELAPNA
ncbi:hypothetical protein [Microbacterium sp. NPDC091676]|uniref:hypothetical protein n=1 Tax=Microbacterium sp. NPDC091676 TaxID=3364212 RepID=UPI0038101B33